MFTVAVITASTELTPLQIRAAFRHIGCQSPLPETELSADACLQFWVLMLIERFKFLAPEQRTLLAEEIVGNLAGLVTAIQSGTVTSPMVVIADARYATWHGYKGWLDLTDARQLATPEKPPLETTAYNLAVLFHRNRAACDLVKRKRTDNDSDPGRAARS